MSVLYTRTCDMHDIVCTLYTSIHVVVHVSSSLSLSPQVGLPVHRDIQSVETTAVISLSHHINSSLHTPVSMHASHTHLHTHTHTHARTHAHTHTHTHHSPVSRQVHQTTSFFGCVCGCVTAYGACIRESLCRDKV